MTPTNFVSFGREESGRVITHDGEFAVVQCRNPYGTHNLCIVDNGNDAFVHGTHATLEWVANHMGKRNYRKVRKHLAARGIGLNWVAVRF